MNWTETEHSPWRSLKTTSHPGPVYNNPPDSACLPTCFKTVMSRIGPRRITAHQATCVAKHTYRDGKIRVQKVNSTKPAIRSKQSAKKKFQTN